jgi:hypothetical protein
MAWCLGAQHLHTLYRSIIAKTTRYPSLAVLNKIIHIIHPCINRRFNRLHICAKLDRASDLPNYAAGLPTLTNAAMPVLTPRQLFLCRLATPQATRTNRPNSAQFCFYRSSSIGDWRFLMYSCMQLGDRRACCLDFGLEECCATNIFRGPQRRHQTSHTTGATGVHECSYLWAFALSTHGLILKYIAAEIRPSRPAAAGSCITPHRRRTRKRIESNRSHPLNRHLVLTPQEA